MHPGLYFDLPISCCHCNLTQPDQMRMTRCGSFISWGISLNLGMRAIRLNIKKKGFNYFVSGAVLFCLTALITEECPLFAGRSVRERAHTVFTAISILFDLHCTADLSAVD